jgi:hypothetical protein
VSNELDIDDVIQRYAVGESARSIGRSYGVDHQKITAVLRERGVEVRNRTDAVSLMLTQPVDAIKRQAIIDRYVTGESMNELSRDLDVGVGIVKRVLLESGVSLRTPKEALQLVRKSATEREQRSERRQLDWSKPILNIPTTTAKRFPGAALTRERSESMQTADERTVLRLLPDSWPDGAQIAVDGYNIDITRGTVAVEVHAAAWYPFSNARVQQRAVDLADRGWHLVYFWISPTHRLDVRGVDEMVTHVEILNRDPAARRQYLVVRGAGEVVSRGRLDPHKRAIVPHSVRGS